MLKRRSFRQSPRRAVAVFGVILVGLATAGAALAVQYAYRVQLGPGQYGQSGYNVRTWNDAYTDVGSIFLTVCTTYVHRDGSRQSFKCAAAQTNTDLTDYRTDSYAAARCEAGTNNPGGTIITETCEASP